MYLQKKNNNMHSNFLNGTKHFHISVEPNLHYKNNFIKKGIIMMIS